MTNASPPCARSFSPRLPLAAGVPLTLELGCGHGHYLNAYAAAHPEEFCVGLDLIADRIARAERKATRARLANLVFVQAEAALFLNALAAAPVSAGVPAPRLRRIFVLFSDPWPKRRHWKHRVLQPALLDTLAALTEAGAALHFRTDHPDYFSYAREVVELHAALAAGRRGGGAVALRARFRLRGTRAGRRAAVLYRAALGVGSGRNDSRH